MEEVGEGEQVGDVVGEEVREEQVASLCSLSKSCLLSARRSSCCLKSEKCSRRGLGAAWAWRRGERARRGERR